MIVSVIPFAEIQKPKIASILNLRKVIVYYSRPLNANILFKIPIYAEIL